MGMETADTKYTYHVAIDPTPDGKAPGVGTTIEATSLDKAEAMAIGWIRAGDWGDGKLAAIDDEGDLRVIIASEGGEDESRISFRITDAADFLGDIGRSGDWRKLRGRGPVAAYTACVFGRNGDQPGEVSLYIESAEMHGIEAYRWSEEDSCDHGGATLDYEEAVRQAEAWAEENDEEPDAEDLIRRIVATGYFGDSNEDDVREVCRQATMHSQGYLLLPRGEFVGHPVGRMWTTNGYLQCPEYVALDATYPSLSYAAAALLEAVEEDDED